MFLWVQLDKSDNFDSLIMTDLSQFINFLQKISNLLYLASLNVWKLKNIQKYNIANDECDIMWKKIKYKTKYKIK